MTKQEFHEQIGFVFGAGCMFIGVAFELFALLADQISRVLHRVADGLTEYALQVGLKID